MADGTVKNIEEEIPFNIPESWYWCRLNNLASYKKGPFGSAITKSIFVPQNNNTYKVYEQGNAINKTVDYGKYYISQEKFHELQSFEIHENDIIVSCAGTIGETFIIPIVHPKGIINQALMKISLFNNISTFYLLYFDRIIKNKSNADSNGSAIKNIPPFDVLKQYLIPIPPLQEQQRIVSKIEELFKQVDAIEEEKQSLLKLIDKAKNKVLDLAMTGKLVKQDPNDEPASRLLEKIFEEKKKLAKEGKIKLSKDELLSPPTSVDNDYYQNIPTSWIISKLGNVGYWGAGSTPRRNVKEFYNGTIPWLKTGELNNDYIFDSKEKITDIAIKKCRFKINFKDDILIAMYGATIGKLGIAGTELVTNQACCGCTPYIYNLYLFFYLMNIKSELISKSFGGAQPNISKEILINTNILIPPYNEQIKIVKTIQYTFNILNQIKDSL